MQRQNFASLIRFSCVLCLGLLVVDLGGRLKPEAAVQTVSFAPKTDFGTGSQPTSVAVGDFNGDGKLDLATANIGAATASILLGTGTGWHNRSAHFRNLSIIRYWDEARDPHSFSKGLFSRR